MVSVLYGSSFAQMWIWGSVVMTTSWGLRGSEAVGTYKWARQLWTSWQGDLGIDGSLHVSNSTSSLGPWVLAGLGILLFRSFPFYLVLTKKLKSPSGKQKVWPPAAVQQERPLGLQGSHLFPELPAFHCPLLWAAPFYLSVAFYYYYLLLSLFGGQHCGQRLGSVVLTLFYRWRDTGFCSGTNWLGTISCAFHRCWGVRFL